MKTLALLALVPAALLLASCGQQTDERVAPEPPAAAQSTVAVPSDEAGEVASSIAAETPFVTIDCVSLQIMPTDTPPDGGAAVGGVSAILQPTGVPSITISTTEPLATELGVADISEGTGAAVQPGDTVTANYCGAGVGSKEVFDSSWTTGQPATFPLDGVIAGWQEGVPGMKVGGQRLLVIPSELGYGESGTGPIGPDETLIFVIELVSIG